MKIYIITLFPNMLKGFFEESIIKRAKEKKLVEIEIINLRDFAIDSYGTVDDRPYGGGAGMILRADVIYKALMKITNNKLQISKPAFAKASTGKQKTILTSPRGKLFTQKKAKEYSKLDHLVIVAGHYEGIDERVSDFVDEEISIGDFVLTGGEIVAAAITDSIVRLIPKVLKKKEATQYESFSEGLLEYPQYTRPENFMGKKVPKILLSGDHKKIEAWHTKKSYEITFKKRKDLLQ